jgi:hypothetical protein
MYGQGIAERWYVITTSAETITAWAAATVAGISKGLTRRHVIRRSGNTLDACVISLFVSVVAFAMVIYNYAIIAKRLRACREQYD